MNPSVAVSLLLLLAAPLPEEARRKIESLEVGEVYQHPDSSITFSFLQKGASGEPSGGWALATSKGCGFKVLIPPPFNEFVQGMKAEDGATISQFMLATRTVEGAKFSVQCLKRSDNKIQTGAAESIVDSFREGFDVTELRSISRADLKGKRAAGSGPRGQFVVEAYQTDSVMYQLIVEYPASERDYMPELAEKFLASFRR